MRYCILPFILILLSFIPLQAEIPDTLWTRAYGDASSQLGSCVDQTADGGFVIFGRTSINSGDQAYLIKIDSLGNVEWSEEYGDLEYDDSFQSGYQDDDGNYICAGYSASDGSNNTDFWLVKIDQDGEIVWSQTYGGAGDDFCESVQPTTDNGFIMVGITNSEPTENSNWWLIKADQNGNEEWNISSGLAQVDVAYDVKQTSDGGFVFTGAYVPPMESYYDFFMTKTDSDGNIEWTYEYGSDNMIDMGNSVVQTYDGGYAAFGKTGTGYNDLLLIKLDSDGAEEWTRSFGSVEYVEYGYCLQQTGDSGFILSSSTAHEGVGHLDAWIIKTDSEGNIQWDYLLGGFDSDYPYSLIITDNLDYVFAGCTFSFGNGGLDVWYAMLEGDQTPTPFHLVSPSNSQMLHTTEVDFAWSNAISMNPDLDVLYGLSINMTMADLDTSTFIQGLSDTVISLSISDLTGLDEWNQMMTGNWSVMAIAGTDTTVCDEDFIFRVSAHTDVETEFNRTIPTEYAIESVYPNPFNSSTTISIALPERSELKLSVYNIKGQEVAVLANQKLNAGYYGFTFNADALSSGVYFVRAIAGKDINLNKKIVYVR